MGRKCLHMTQYDDATAHNYYIVISPSDKTRSGLTKCVLLPYPTHYCELLGRIKSGGRDLRTTVNCYLIVNGNNSNSISTAPYTVIANKLKLKLKISADFGVARDCEYYPLIH